MTLVEFIKARLSEDERAAQAVAWTELAASWHVALTGVASGLGLVVQQVDIIADQRKDVAEHIARHDPARVLAEVAAKRRIIAEYERYAAERRRELGGWNTDKVSPILTALASVYADHPDYDEAWRPA